MSKTKKNGQIKHAKMRALERYGLDLSDDEYYQIRNLITGNKSKPLHRQSNRVALHEVEWNNTKMIVVYDSKRKTIVSFLPRRRNG